MAKQEEKCEEVVVDGLSDLKETAEVRIRGVKRSLEDDIKFVQEGDIFLNKKTKDNRPSSKFFRGI